MLLALAVLQVVLPPIATLIVRGRLGNAKIKQVSLSAFPAIKLLWGHADSATLRLSSDDIVTGRVGGVLGEASNVTTVDARVGVMRVGPLQMQDVVFEKAGDHATISLHILVRDLQSALPIIQSLTPVSSTGGHLKLRGTADALGLRPSVDMDVEAKNGDVVIAPAGLASLIGTIKVFSSPQLHVDSVGGHATAGGVDVIVHAHFV